MSQGEEGGQTGCAEPGGLGFSCQAKWRILSPRGRGPDLGAHRHPLVATERTAGESTHRPARSWGTGTEATVQVSSDGTGPVQVREVGGLRKHSSHDVVLSSELFFEDQEFRFDYVGFEGPAHHQEKS